MKLTATIHLGEEFDTERLAEWISIGKELDTPLWSGVTLGTVEDTEVADDTVAPAVHQAPPQPGQVAAPAPARRGRKTKAEKEADDARSAAATLIAAQAGGLLPPQSQPPASFMPPLPPQQAAPGAMPPLPPQTAPTPPMPLPAASAPVAPPPAPNGFQRPEPLRIDENGAPVYSRDHLRASLTAFPNAGPKFFKYITKEYGFRDADAVPDPYVSWAVAMMYDESLN